jgi:hypothetical protein
MNNSGVRGYEVTSSSSKARAHREGLGVGNRGNGTRIHSTKLASPQQPYTGNLSEGGEGTEGSVPDMSKC